MPNAIGVVKAEIHRVSVSLRTSNVVALPARFEREVPESEVGNKYLRTLSSLYRDLQTISDLNEIGAVAFVKPLVDIIEAEEVNSVITSTALSALSKFIAYGLFNAEMVLSIEALNRIAQASTSCVFESTNKVDGEVALMRLLELMSYSLRCSLGSFLTNENVFEMAECILRASLYKEASHLLRRSAESTLQQLIMHVFSRTSEIVEISSHENENESVISIATRFVPYGSPVLCRLVEWLCELIGPKHLGRSSRLLGLELINIVLETGGAHLAEVPGMLSIIQGELCRCLILNSRTSDLPVLALTLRVIFNLFQSLKKHLKVQLEVFMVSVHLHLVDSKSVPPEQRELALESLLEFCREPGMMLDLFVNFDCDVGSVNLFEQLSKSLGRAATPEPGQPLNSLHVAAMDALMAIVTGMAHRCPGHPSFRPPLTDAEMDDSDSMLSESPIDSSLDVSDDDALPSLATPDHSKRKRIKKPNFFFVSPNGVSRASEVSASALRQKRLLKSRLALVSSRFNSESKDWMEYGSQLGILPTPVTPQSVALFLRDCPGLDRALVGAFISEPKLPKYAFNNEVSLAFLSTFDFHGLSIDEALREFLSAFLLPGEAQKIERLMESFALKFFEESPGILKNSDAAFVLAYSVIMLNTDLHNKQVRRKMTQEEFLRNNRGVNGGEDLPEEYLLRIYESIRKRQIIMTADSSTIVNDSSRNIPAASASVSGDSVGVANQWDSVLMRQKQKQKSSYYSSITGVANSSNVGNYSSSSSVVSLDMQDFYSSPLPIIGEPDREMLQFVVKSVISATAEVLSSSRDSKLIARTSNGILDLCLLCSYFKMGSVVNKAVSALARTCLVDLENMVNLLDNNGSNVGGGAAGAETLLALVKSAKSINQLFIHEFNQLNQHSGANAAVTTLKSVDSEPLELNKHRTLESVDVSSPSPVASSVPTGDSESPESIPEAQNEAEFKAREKVDTARSTSTSGSLPLSPSSSESSPLLFSKLTILSTAAFNIANSCIGLLREEAWRPLLQLFLRICELEAAPRGLFVLGQPSSNPGALAGGAGLYAGISYGLSQTVTSSSLGHHTRLIGSNPLSTYAYSYGAPFSVPLGLGPMPAAFSIPSVVDAAVGTGDLLRGLLSVDLSRQRLQELESQMGDSDVLFRVPMSDPLTQLRGGSTESLEAALQQLRNPTRSPVVEAALALRGGKLTDTLLLRAALEASTSGADSTADGIELSTGTDNQKQDKRGGLIGKFSEWMGAPSRAADDSLETLLTALSCTLSSSSFCRFFESTVLLSDAALLEFVYSFTSLVSPQFLVQATATSGRDAGSLVAADKPSVVLCAVLQGIVSVCVTNVARIGVILPSLIQLCENIIVSIDPSYGSVSAVVNQVVSLWYPGNAAPAADVESLVSLLNATSSLNTHIPDTFVFIIERMVQGLLDVVHALVAHDARSSVALDALLGGEGDVSEGQIPSGLVNSSSNQSLEKLTNNNNPSSDNNSGGAGEPRNTAGALNFHPNGGIEGPLSTLAVTDLLLTLLLSLPQTLFVFVAPRLAEAVALLMKRVSSPSLLRASLLSADTSSVHSSSGSGKKVSPSEATANVAALGSLVDPSLWSLSPFQLAGHKTEPSGRGSAQFKGPLPLSQHPLHSFFSVGLCIVARAQPVLLAGPGLWDVLLTLSAATPLQELARALPSFLQDTESLLSALEAKGDSPEKADGLQASTALLRPDMERLQSAAWASLGALDSRVFETATVLLVRLLMPDCIFAFSAGCAASVFLGESHKPHRFRGSSHASGDHPSPRVKANHADSSRNIGQLASRQSLDKTLLLALKDHSDAEIKEFAAMSAMRLLHTMARTAPVHPGVAGMLQRDNRCICTLRVLRSVAIALMQSSNSQKTQPVPPLPVVSSSDSSSTNKAATISSGNTDSKTTLSSLTHSRVLSLLIRDASSDGSQNLGTDTSKALRTLAFPPYPLNFAPESLDPVQSHPATQNARVASTALSLVLSMIQQLVSECVEISLQGYSAYLGTVNEEHSSHAAMTARDLVLQWGAIFMEALLPLQQVSLSLVLNKPTLEASSLAFLQGASLEDVPEQKGGLDSFAAALRRGVEEELSRNKLISLPAVEAYIQVNGLVVRTLHRIVAVCDDMTNGSFQLTLDDSVSPTPRPISISSKPSEADIAYVAQKCTDLWMQCFTAALVAYQDVVPVCNPASLSNYRNAAASTGSHSSTTHGAAQSTKGDTIARSMLLDEASSDVGRLLVLLVGVDAIRTTILSTKLTTPVTDSENSQSSNLVSLLERRVRLAAPEFLPELQRVLGIPSSPSHSQIVVPAFPKLDRVTSQPVSESLEGVERVNFSDFVRESTPSATAEVDSGVGATTVVTVSGDLPISSDATTSINHESSSAPDLQANIENINNQSAAEITVERIEQNESKLDSPPESLENPIIDSVVAEHTSSSDSIQAVSNQSVENKSSEPVHEVPSEPSKAVPENGGFFSAFFRTIIGEIDAEIE